MEIKHANWTKYQDTKDEALLDFNDIIFTAAYNSIGKTGKLKRAPVPWELSNMNSEFQPVRTDEGEEFNQNEKWRIWKNVLVLGFAFMLHFTAFWGSSNLQSSVNSDEALGTFTLASIYSSLIVSNILLSSFVIEISKTL
ncbi:hypothetical protein HHI36_007592 [Cryptolaemus montrouzieri]|uniref:Uncharacterized protein n=1 Tax=Cryptolaemus montrouzieri TaxID=559131 RepID=A0ABD2MQU5_9CUCU